MRNFREYEVWGEAMTLVKMIYEHITSLPYEEKYGLSDQIRRAAVSIPSNIAEGAGRLTSADFLHFLSISLGSAYEVETQLLLLVELNFTTMNAIQKTLEQVHKVEKQLSLFIKTINQK